MLLLQALPSFATTGAAPHLPLSYSAMFCYCSADCQLFLIVDLEASFEPAEREPSPQRASVTFV